MRKYSMLFAAGAVAVVTACSRTENGDVVIKRPASVDRRSTMDTFDMPTVTTKTDTINTPVVVPRRKR